MRKRLTIASVVCLIFFSLNSYAADKLKPVPEIDFLTWSAGKYMIHFETTKYIAEEWEKLGLKVKVNQQVFPNPMLKLWFKEHRFDCVLSSLSGQNYRIEPSFFTNTQFNSTERAPGKFNVGEWTNAEYDKIGNKQLEIYDSVVRKPLIDRLQEIYYEEQPETLIYYYIQNNSINTKNCDVDYLNTPDGLRSIWNLLRFTPKGDVKTLKVGIVVDQDTWNPLAAIQSNDTEVLRLVYDRLVQVGPKGETRMWAAEAVNMIDDTTIDVALRKDLKFSDGKPVTAEDVKFSYEYYKKWKAAYFMKYIKPINRIEITDLYRLRFYLEKPFAPFIMNTLGQVFILPKHVWEGIVKREGLTKPQDYANVPLIGSGCFTLEYWKESQEFLLKANKDHFMAPKANLLYVAFGSREVLNSATVKGSIDINIQDLPPTLVAEFKKDPHIKVFPISSNGYASVRYQCQRPIFKHKALRQACAYAIPRAKIIKELLGGFGGISPSSITPVNDFWHNHKLKAREFSLEKARQTLKDAGFRWNAEGRLCFPVE